MKVTIIGGVARRFLLRRLDENAEIVKVIACIESPVVIRKIFDHL